MHWSSNSSASLPQRCFGWEPRFWQWNSLSPWSTISKTKVYHYIQAVSFAILQKSASLLQPFNFPQNEKQIYRALEDQIWILNLGHFSGIQIWILNPELFQIWILNLESRTVSNKFSPELVHQFWILNPALFEIWISNPWTIIGFEIWIPDPLFKGPINLPATCKTQALHQTGNFLCISYAISPLISPGITHLPSIPILTL